MQLISVAIPYETQLEVSIITGSTIQQTTLLLAFANFSRKAMAKPKFVRRDIIVCFDGPDCGHHVRVWADHFDDETWELHGDSACRRCRRFVEQVFRAAEPDMPIHFRA